MRTLTNDYFRQTAYIRKAIEEAQVGRTFYEDYFKGKTYKELSRLDRILYLLLEADQGTGLLGEPSEVANLKYELANKSRFLENRHVFDLTGEKPLTLEQVIAILEKLEMEKLVYIKILDREYEKLEFVPLEFVTNSNSIFLEISNRPLVSCSVQQLLQEAKYIQFQIKESLEIKIKIMNKSISLLRIRDTEDFTYLEFGEIEDDLTQNCQGEI